MSNIVLGYIAVAIAACAPSITFLCAPYFRRTNRARVTRFLLNFVIWATFAPIVALGAAFMLTPESTHAARDIFDWWGYTSLGVCCLVLLIITIIIAYKRHDPARPAAVNAFNNLALTEISGFVLNNAQSLWVIAGFLVAAGSDMLTVVGYAALSVGMVFIAWAIAP